jgi:hypothetical protein
MGMRHLDARQIRERLNALALALATLERNCTVPRHHEIVTLARKALGDIAVLVTRDEKAEHQFGRQPMLKEDKQPPAAPPQ